MYPSACSSVFPIASASFFLIQKLSSHHGICSKPHLAASLFFISSTETFSVLTLIDFLRKDNEYFLNSSKSVNFEYLSMNASLNFNVSAFGIGTGIFFLLFFHLYKFIPQVINISSYTLIFKMLLLQEWEKDIEAILASICNQLGSSKKSSKQVSVNYPWELLDAFLANFHLPGSGGKGAVEIGVVNEISSRIFVEANGRIKAPGRIDGSVYIGANSVINPNSYIRGPVVIGDNCIVGGEIKNSIILHNSHLAHSVYVGDSIIGRNCNLGAGTILSNQRLDKKDVVVHIAGQRYISRRKKLGAIVEDCVQVGSNAVLNPGAYIKKGVLVLPGAVVTGYKS